MKGYFIILFYEHWKKIKTVFGYHPNFGISFFFKLKKYVHFKDAAVYTNYLQVRTKGESPSAPPVRVTAEPLTSTSIRVSWQPPATDTHHGTLLGFSIGLKDHRYKILDLKLILSL